MPNSPQHRTPHLDIARIDSLGPVISWISPPPSNSVTAPVFTVFTPAYNRAVLLPTLRESLRKQTFTDFEWVIVDDGSKDNTAELVAEWMLEGDLPIRYFRKENGGKHTALNLGIKEAHGRFFVVVDSDDCLLPDALQILLEEWDATEDKEFLIGICGLFQYADGRIVGDPFPSERLRSNAVDLRFKLRVRGDKVGLMRIEVLRAYPFPEEFGRVYLPESIVWNRIAQDYDTIFVNRQIGVKDYQPDGITDRAALNSARNPFAYRLMSAELLNGKRELLWHKRCRCILTATKCSLRARCNPFVSSTLGDKVLTLLSLPMAIVLNLRDSLLTIRTGIKS